MSTPVETSGLTFRKVVKGENFMTPQVLKYITVRDYEVELSQGNGIGGTPIFGVTVVNRVTMEQDHEQSQCFESKKQALAYINELGRDWRE